MYFLLIYHYDEHAVKKLKKHFFAPLEGPGELIYSLLYPLEGIFEETIPNLISCAYLVGKALEHGSLMLGQLALLQKSEAKKEAALFIDQILGILVTLSLAILGPMLETLRIFTRFGGTIYHNINIEEKKTHTAKP